MSIQSEIDRINGEVVDQTDLLGQIVTALGGKVGIGGSGGESAGLKFVSGTTALTITTDSTVATGTIVAEVTDLEFTPKHVIVWLASTITPTYTSGTPNWYFVMAQGGLYTSSIHSRKSSSSTSTRITDTSSGPFTAIRIIDNGFQMVPTLDIVKYDSANLNYLAIG